MPDAIVVQDLGKRFRRYHLDRPVTIHEALLRGFRKLRPADYFWGLRGISFRIAAGRMVGVMGRNGAGKSTLLRLIGGVGKLDEGTLRAHGRIRGLLSLGAGFHPELTGRENLFINGVIGGLTRREVEARFDAIVEYSELEAYMNSPLRAFSSGMQMRLAFSIAIHSDPDILLIDEVLAVGDQAFQRKCLDTIAGLKAKGCTIIVVSHDAGVMRDICDECLWLNAGQLIAQGPSDEVVRKYLAQVNTETWSHLPVAHTAPAPPAENLVPPSLQTPATPDVEITAVRMSDSSGAAVSSIDPGAALIIEIDFAAQRPIPILNFAVHLYRDDGVRVCDLNTQAPYSSLADVSGEGQLLLHLEQLDLNAGTYLLDVQAYGSDPAYTFDSRKGIEAITIRPAGDNRGILCPPYRWESRRSASQRAGDTLTEAS